MRTILHTLAYCVLALALYQWGFYAPLHKEAVATRQVLRDAGAKLDVMQTNLNDITGGLQRCWQAHQYEAWKDRWGR